MSVLILQPPARVRAALIGIAAAALTSSAQAQFHTARVDSIFPLGAKAGTSVDLTFSGGNLDGARAFLCDHPGITGEWIEGAKFKVNVAPEVKLGVYEVRFSGQWGVSSPRRFIVGDRDEAVVPAEASDRAKAMELAVGTVYNGRVEAGKAQFLKLSAEAGRRLFIGCFAERIGTRLDASLVLLDPSGVEVARSREAVFGDPLIDYTPATDGDYLIQLSDFLARGGSDYGYRLLARSSPQIDFVLPASAQPGTKQTFEVFGRNLPNGAPSSDGLERIELTVDVPGEAERMATAPVKPAATGAGTTGFHLRLGSGADGSNLFFVPHSPAPVLADAGGNASADSARIVPVPSEIGGRFYPGATEWFEFAVTKGKSYAVEAISQRFSSPSDPVLEVFKVNVDGEGKESLAKLGGGDDDAKNIGGRGYPTNHRDPIYRFTADYDGKARAALRDQFGTRSSYRLSVREPQPDFELLVSPPKPADFGGKKVVRSGVAIRRGETARLDVMTVRRDGFDGSIELSLEGLPDGIQVTPGSIGKGQDRTVVSLHVPADTPAWSGVVKVIGSAQLGESKVAKAAHSVALNWTVNDTDQERAISSVGKDLSIAAIDEDAPLTVGVVEDKVWETSLAGKVDLPVKLVSKTEIKDKVIVQAVDIPGTGDKPLQMTIDKGKDSGTLSLQFLNNRDKNSFRPGTHRFWLKASTKIGYRPGVAKANAAEEAKKAAVAEAEARTKARDEAQAGLEAARAAKAETEVQKAEKVAAAEAALKAAEQALAVAETAKTKAGEVAKQEAERSKPRDAQVATYSTPITVRIAPAPAKVTAAEPGRVAKGAKLELPVGVQRLYGFADEVKLSAKFPDGTKGISAPEVAVAKDAGEGKLVIDAAGDAAPGEIAFEIIAKMKFNGVDLETRAPAKLIVTES